MAASITFPGAVLDSIDEGRSAFFIDGTATLSSVWEVITAQYPTADRSRTSFWFSLDLDPGSVANRSDFPAARDFTIDTDGGVSGFIQTNDDTENENDEAFSFQPVLTRMRIRDASGNILADLSPDQVTALFAPSGGLTLDLGKITGTIIDNDDPPPNQAPTAVNLSNTTPDLDENTSTTTRIKVADVTVTDDGRGTNNLSLTGTDAAAFELAGTVLYLKAGTVLDYEAKSSYSVTVNVDDPAAGTASPDASNTFILTIRDLVENTAPTDLALSPSSVDENVAAGTAVGSFSTTDAEGSAFTYALVSGTGDTDNAAFTIDGNQLKINTSPDFETKSSYSIRVKTTDAGGLSYEEALTIGINNVNEVPSATGELGTALPPIQFNGGQKGLRRKGTNRNDTLRGSSKNDILIGLSGNDKLLSGSKNFRFGRDRLLGGAGDDLLVSGAGNDLLDGGSGNDRLKAGRGNDLLLGGDGNDSLWGDEGDDVITGGTGTDTSRGGAGRDTFVFNAVSEGTDIIQDFEGTADLIDLRSIFAQAAFSGATPFARYSQFIQLVQVGSDTAITIDADGNGAGSDFTTLVTLSNVSLSAVSSKNFVIT